MRGLTGAMTYSLRSAARDRLFAMQSVYHRNEHIVLTKRGTSKETHQAASKEADLAKWESSKENLSIAGPDVRLPQQPPALHLRPCGAERCKVERPPHTQAAGAVTNDRRSVNTNTN